MLENKYRNLYTDSDPSYNKYLERNKIEFMMPRYLEWFQYDLEKGNYYTKEDIEWNSFNKESKVIDPPDEKYWRFYSSSVKKTEDFDQKVSLIGMQLFAKIGATKSEMELIFGAQGLRVANEMNLEDLDITPSLVKVPVPDPDIEATVKSGNPDYPPISIDYYAPHHQDFEIYECKHSKIEFKKENIIVGHRFEDFGISNVCDSDKIDRIFTKKEDFRVFNRSDFESARTKANPYETIGKTVFMNRAAVKMANLDAIFNFTNSICFDRPPLVPPCSSENDTFYFADICAGPGGFSQYLYWRLQGRARGFGMTLKGDHDWAEPSRFIVDVTSFNRFYGESKTGDIFLSQNIQGFGDKIFDESFGKMVELVVADGGMDVDGGEENYQEQVHKRLVLCQFLCALHILRKGGSFVCKVFDCYTDFTVGIIYIMSLCFRKFCIIKPYTSRPANSERYVVFSGLIEQHPFAEEYFAHVNDKYSEVDKDDGVLSVYPVSQIPSDFLDYVKKSNEELVESQYTACHYLLTYGFNPAIPTIDQEDVKKRCIKEWKLDEAKLEKRFPRYVTDSYHQKNYTPPHELYSPHDNKPQQREIVVMTYPSHGHMYHDGKTITSLTVSSIGKALEFEVSERKSYMVSFIDQKNEESKLLFRFNK